jgi:iron complex outermembrane receptor protein
LQKQRKSPNRDDFETAATDAPKPEKLLDFEAGYEQRKKYNYWGINSYYMSYKDQSVLTGK